MSILLPDRSVALPFQSAAVPSLVELSGEQAKRRYLEFFTANIRNHNTREAYHRASDLFLSWCERNGLGDLRSIEPVVVATWIEVLQRTHSPPSVKQHLAAIRMLFDWLVVGQIVPHNPAASVRGPRHVTKRGKTPVLTAEETRLLLDSLPIGPVDKPDLAAYRDRALIATMVFSFARVGAVVRMLVEDYHPRGKRWWLRLHEKGGKVHEVPTHHTLEEYLDEWLTVSNLRADGKGKGPLFPAIRGRTGTLSDSPMTRNDALRAIKRRARAAGLPAGSVCCHTFRATGITTFLENGGSLETAQAIAAHESPRTTMLYDRTGEKITLDEIERVRI